MSDILFCHTDGNQFFPDTCDISKNYQCSGILRLSPDILGLGGLYDHDIDWEKYKLIYCHLNPTITWPPWYEFPKILKRLAPQAILIVAHEYLDKYTRKNNSLYPDEKLTFEIKRGLERADYLVAGTKSSYDTMSELLNIQVIYVNIGQPMVDELEWSDPKPWDERDGVFILDHTIWTPMIRKMEAAKISGLPVKIVTANVVSVEKDLKQLGDAYRVDGEFHGRLEWKDYMEILSSCRVAVEMDYCGISRMAYEAAKVNIPVVGTRDAWYRFLLYPELTIRTSREAGNLLRKIHDGPEPKSLNSYSRMLIDEYWSQDAVGNRTMKMLYKVGYFPEYTCDVCGKEVLKGVPMCDECYWWLRNGN